MLAAFVKAFGQLDDPRILRLVLGGVVLSAAVFAGLWAAVSTLLIGTRLFEAVWLDTAVDVLGGLATLAVTWLLFPAVVSTTIALFLEGVAGAVEARHYPGRGPARAQGVAGIIAGSARFFAVLVVLNLVALAFLLVPPVFPFVFYGINGYLLGREYFELVALRRLSPEAADALRRAHGRRVTTAGVAIAVILTVPLVNLVAPIVGTAAMVHLFEDLRRAA